MRDNTTRGRGPSPRPLMAALVLVGLACALALTPACGGGDAPPAPEIPASFPAATVAALDSDSGALHIDVRSFPAPLVRGQNVGQVTVTDANGQPVDGLTLTVQPWMPSHGHGTSVEPIISPASSSSSPSPSPEVGVFVANPLYLFMAGQWELRMTFDGALHDTATAIVEIP